MQVLAGEAAPTFEQMCVWHALEIDRHYDALRAYWNALDTLDGAARHTFNMPDGAARAYLADWTYAYINLRGPGFPLIGQSLLAYVQATAVYIHASGRVHRILDLLHEDYASVACSCGLPTFRTLSGEVWRQWGAVEAGHAPLAAAVDAARGHGDLWTTPRGLAAMEVQSQAIQQEQRMILSQQMALRQRLEGISDIAGAFGGAEPRTAQQLANLLGVEKQIVQRHASQLRDRDPTFRPQRRGLAFVFDPEQQRKISDSVRSNGRPGARKIL